MLLVLLFWVVYVSGTRACLEALTQASSGEEEEEERERGARTQHPPKRGRIIAMAGGATRSPLWLQMHADVTQRPVHVGECENAPLLGGAVLAAAAVRHETATVALLEAHHLAQAPPLAQQGGLQQEVGHGLAGGSTETEATPACKEDMTACIEQCVQDMVRQRAVIQPSTECGVQEAYEHTYRQYVLLAPALAGVFDAIAR